MSNSKIAGRYAKALMDQAVEQNQLDAVVSDVQSFLEVAENKEFMTVLKSPIINTSKKSNIFKALFEERFNKITMLFFNIILVKHREAALVEIANEFMTQYKSKQQISTVTLTTATAMDAASVEAIRQRMISSKHTAADVEIKTIIDPSIIGGFVLDFDGKQYDSSVLNQLTRLKDEFDDNDYISKVVKK